MTPAEVQQDIQRRRASASAASASSTPSLTTSTPTTNSGAQPPENENYLSRALTYAKAHAQTLLDQGSFLIKATEPILELLLFSQTSPVPSGKPRVAIAPQVADRLIQLSARLERDSPPPGAPASLASLNQTAAKKLQKYLEKPGGELVLLSRAFIPARRPDFRDFSSLMPFVPSWLRSEMRSEWGLWQAAPDPGPLSPESVVDWWTQQRVHWPTLTPYAVYFLLQPTSNSVAEELAKLWKGSYRSDRHRLAPSKASLSCALRFNSKTD
jgi:hypothetical protein